MKSIKSQNIKVNPMETTKYGTFYFANFLFFLTFKVLLAIHFHFHFITITNMRTALLIFLVVIVCAQPKLNYLSGNQAKASVEDLVNRFASLQTEIYKKVFQHYMFEEIASLRSKAQSENQIKQRVVLLLTDPNGPLLKEMTKFMQDRLFKKLEIGLLTSSLRAEIIQNPENFYMTFDIYDLLFD